MTGDRWPHEVTHLPVCPRRQLPIPFIAEVGAGGIGHFTILDDDRARECLAGRLCAMCGLPMGDEVALLGDVASLRPGGYWIEPPVHERCGEIAAGGLCPFVSHERVPRRPPAADVAVVGMSPAELADIGRTIPKRPWVMAITKTYDAALTVNHTGGLTMVYQAGPITRVRRYDWDPAGRAVEVISEPNRTVRVVRVQRHRRKSRGKRLPASQGAGSRF